jgi:hypothetical protein
VIGRLRQHVTAKTHFSASLAYLMVKQELNHSMRRQEAMKDKEFLRSFTSCQERLRRMSAATVEIADDVRLYAFELYACMDLGCWQYNSFRTH